MSTQRQIAAAMAHVRRPRTRKPAEVELNVALIRAEDDGKFIPCRAWPDWFMSEFAWQREQAVPLCADCPIRRECHRAAVANREQFGVWGGVDRTRETVA